MSWNSNNTNSQNDMDLHNKINQTSTNTNNVVVDNLNANVTIPQTELNNNSQEASPLFELPDNNSEMFDDNGQSYRSYESFLSHENLDNLEYSIKNFTKQVNSYIDWSKGGQASLSNNSDLVYFFMGFAKDSIEVEDSGEEILTKDNENLEKFRSTIRDVFTDTEKLTVENKLQTIFPKPEELTLNKNELLQQLNSYGNQDNIVSKFLDKLTLLDSSGELTIYFYETFVHLSNFFF